jgi:hypothetical protein
MKEESGLLNGAILLILLIGLGTGVTLAVIHLL